MNTPQNATQLLVQDFQKNFEQFKQYIYTIRSNFEVVKMYFKEIMSVSPLFTHSKLWKLYFEIAFETNFDAFLFVVSLWLLSAPPSPSTAIFLVDKLKLIQSKFPPYRYEQFLIDIIEKTGQAPNMNSLWETLIHSIQDPQSQQIIFSMYNDLYPPLPDKQSPQRILVRFNEIKIQTTFFQEIKHGKMLILQKRPKSQPQNSPFIKTFSDLLDTEYLRQKQNMFVDVSPLSFGALFYFLEKTMSIVLKLLYFKSDVVYKWLKRYADHLLELTLFAQAKTKTPEMQRFALRTLLIKRTTRFTTLFQVVTSQNKSLSLIDKDGFLWANYFKLRLRCVDLNTRSSYLQKIEQVKDQLKVTYLPLSLQLVKFSLFTSINANQLNIVDLDNLFNQFSDSYNPELLSDLELVCKSYMDFFFARGNKDVVITIFEALINFPGEKRKWLIWKDYAETLARMELRDLSVKAYLRALPFLDEKEAEAAWASFYSYVQPGVSMEQFKSSQNGRIIPPERKQFIRVEKQQQQPPQQQQIPIPQQFQPPQQQQMFLQQQNQPLYQSQQMRQQQKPFIPNQYQGGYMQDQPFQGQY
ncbi:hypothetical protein EIN_268600 [Entamoeba invadens IP1]|uniref:Uncharacterized protein n=1 Tax=Entamoeba invadens IP1 TaxID=370355 RepID=A0A0A1U845_ENTIV|nr:hypothetical protein EIN_268600 [Entamoeba invadens IP1]ELP91104.1 hypothetical protein EIN_268600 [Entamoeba invadens IP1]|eukprot:XP_004257875.1 hypothetical protein EIN_268600 [Entamoeba invadens IP1]